MLAALRREKPQARDDRRLRARRLCRADSPVPGARPKNRRSAAATRADADRAPAAEPSRRRRPVADLRRGGVRDVPRRCERRAGAVEPRTDAGLPGADRAASPSRPAVAEIEWPRRCPSRRARGRRTGRPAAVAAPAARVRRADGRATSAGLRPSRSPSIVRAVVDEPVIEAVGRDAARRRGRWQPTVGASMRRAEPQPVGELRRSVCRPDGRAGARRAVAPGAGRLARRRHPGRGAGARRRDAVVREPRQHRERAGRRAGRRSTRPRRPGEPVRRHARAAPLAAAGRRASRRRRRRRRSSNRSSPRRRRAAAAAPIEVPGIDPSLFAVAGGAPPTRGRAGAARLARPSPRSIAFAVADPVLRHPSPASRDAGTRRWRRAPSRCASRARTRRETASEPVLDVRGAERRRTSCSVESELPVFEDGPGRLRAGRVRARSPRSPAPRRPRRPLDEEIALDVDAFAPRGRRQPVRPTARASRSPSWTSFGDAWSDFEVPGVAAVAADLGVDDQPAAGSVRGARGSPGRQEPCRTGGGADPRRRSAVDDRRRGAQGQPRRVGHRGVRARRRARGGRQGEAEEGTRRCHARCATPRPSARRSRSGPCRTNGACSTPSSAVSPRWKTKRPPSRRPARDGTRVRVISY